MRNWGSRGKDKKGGKWGIRAAENGKNFAFVICDFYEAYSAYAETQEKISQWKFSQGIFYFP